MKGFVKVAAATPAVSVADCKYNAEQIGQTMVLADGSRADIVVFPELSLTAYTCQDLFQQQLLLDEAEAALLGVLELNRALRIVAVVGMPLRYGGRLLNCAVVMHKGKICGIVPKTYIPNYGEFYEARWFSGGAQIEAGATMRLCGQNVPIGTGLVFETDTYNFGIEICEDLWAPEPPSTSLALAGADIVLNLSASDELVGKHDYLRSLVTGQSARTLSAYVYSGCGYGESTQDVVFGGLGFVAENGRMLAEAERFSRDAALTVADVDVEKLRHHRLHNTTFAQAAGAVSQKDIRRIEIPQVPAESDPDELPQRPVNPLPFVPQGTELERRCEEILSIQALGLVRRLEHTHAKSAVIGISGGLDSTLALLVCVRAFDILGIDRTGIVGITMPGFGTTDRTYQNALQLMRGLGVTMREINIREACEVHFRDLGIDPSQHDVTYENSQARERTQILMDVANQTGGFVVGTGDLSELALGWATYNGDHMSMYGVNASVPKTLVRHLVRYFATLPTTDKDVSATLLDIVDTPISPELIPADEAGNITQKTEDLVGPYELHDFFLYHFLRHGRRPEKIFQLARVAFRKPTELTAAHTDEEIRHWLSTFLRRFFAQQFKRSCLPDGPKVGSVSLSPRGDWRMPSDASSALWMETMND